jgi:hypothetical protein
MHIIKDLLLMAFGYCLDTDLLKKLCLYLVLLFAQDLFSHIAFLNFVPIILLPLTHKPRTCALRSR